MDFTSFFAENFTTVLVFCVTAVLVYSNTRRRAGVPPGPPCWPLFGNLGSLAGKDVLHNLEQLRAKYGDVYGLYIGKELNIVLSGYDTIHEALVKRGTLFSRRPRNEYTDSVHKETAIVFGNDLEWKELRTFTMNTLRELCFRKTGITLEHRINDELAHFIKALLECKGDTDCARHISLSFADIILSVLHGRRNEYSDKKFLWYMSKMEEAFQYHIKIRILHHCVPFLRYLPGDFLYVKYTDKMVKDFTDYCSEVCKPNVDTYVPGNENCFIDFWLTAQANESSSSYETRKLYSTYHDLMGAGSETSATTLKWIILALVKNPAIQKKLQKQVDSVLGKDQTPSTTDRTDLPYVEAVVLEGLRFGTAVPLSIPHAVQQDTVFKGYLIPKDATVLPNIVSVHYDPELFPDPEVFKPERFLNADESKIIGTKHLIPFSLGPRSCIGETLARTELFLYVATLSQKLEFLPPEGEDLPSTKGEVGLTHKPKPFKVRIRSRMEA